ncbi:MAG TPA: prepilin-type N-terminal cleavage/methylation domain-containing protein [Candidatus Limnocylindrales bacterium]|nr:prepilin-type N-terminal cleavage/methylation domain-containing protein [Candidatus Limnocylindrales bacterium]
MRLGEKGFSLVELLIVVAILLTLAAIAIPNLMRARMAANEASAVASLRTINSAAVLYESTWANGFPPSLDALGTTGPGPATCENAELIDAVLTTGTKSGYTFAWVKGTLKLTKANSACKGGYGFDDGYAVTATPIDVGLTGQRAFCTDATGVIRYTTNGKPKTTKPNCSTTMTPLQ